ncbi:MAG: HigA family addiction module antidote protein [Cytophagales bacterium]|nr:HigA family addiction module antidote protein [Cytophagales bacterium]
MNKSKPIKLTKEIVPGQAFHPGIFLNDEIKYRNINQKELAKTMGITPITLSEIIHGKKNITPAIALKLEKALDIDAQSWMRLQLGFELDSIRIKHRNEIANTSLSKKQKESLTQKVLQQV